MKNSIRYSLLAVLVTFATTLTAGERVGDFALIDHQGAFQHMAWYDDHSAVVILPQANGSTDPSVVEGLKALQSQYADQGVAFFMLNPGLQEDRDAVAADIASLGLDISVLMDDTQLVTESLGITHLDQAVVYSPSSFEVVYRGPVQDELNESIQSLLDGDRAELITATTSGAAIEFATTAAHANLSYEKDIAPIIAESCAECHREGGIAPFAMDSNLAVQGWSPMIREVILTKRMPPGQVDNKV
ncbi:MAG: hypothetical protein HOG51_01960, partial [Gammaproteobacteria bacterium]|nr:hypothetical protein [Gammaproteobacteria bacterium]